MMIVYNGLVFYDFPWF